MTYLFWLIHLTCGALTDSRMWGEKEKDSKFVKDYTDFFWLGWYSILPFIAIWFNQNGADILSVKSALIGFSLSIVWDLLYSKLEYGKWIVPLPLWLIIPTKNGRLVIGFNTVGKMIIFDWFRVVILMITFLIN